MFAGCSFRNLVNEQILTEYQAKRFLNNKAYEDCLKGISFLSNYNNGRPQSAGERDAGYERGRHYCNRQAGYEH